MKKLFLNIVLLLILAFTLTSCGNDEKTIKFFVDFIALLFF